MKLKIENFTQNQVLVFIYLFLFDEFDYTYKICSQTELDLDKNLLQQTQVCFHGFCF